MKQTSVSLEDDVATFIDDLVHANMIRGRHDRRSVKKKYIIVSGASDFINTVARRLESNKKLQREVFGKTVDD